MASEIERKLTPGAIFTNVPDEELGFDFKEVGTACWTTAVASSRPDGTPSV
jgi:hypothetical protein